MENEILLAKEDNTAKSPTEIVIVLDRSGSMDNIAKATVEGLNTFIKEQKGAEGEAYMTLVQFDDRYEVDYKSKNINEVEDLINGVTYIPRGTTALFDSIGRTINEINSTSNDVIFVIITDGHENSSKEFNRDTVFKKIEEKKSNGWNFIYLGANQDAISAASSLGISKDFSIDFNSNTGSVNASYSNISNKLSSYRSSKVRGIVSDEDLKFNDNDRKDLNI